MLMVLSIEALTLSIINGLVTGSMYALMAVGFTLIYGILHIVNFSHGAFYMIGAYVAFLIISSLGLDPIIGIIAAFTAVFIFGIIIERSLFNPLRKAGRDILLNSMLITMGLSILLENVMLETFGAYPKSQLYYYPGYVQIFDTRISLERIIFLITGIALVTSFSVFIKYTKPGKAIRAVAMNAEAAKAAGIEIPKIYTLTFAIGCGLAAVAGALLLPINFAHPFVGQRPMMIMFVVVVLGGLGSVAGSLFAAYILGLTESIVTLLYGSVIHDMIAFLILLMVLLLRPQGILGWERPRL